MEIEPLRHEAKPDFSTAFYAFLLSILLAQLGINGLK